MHAWIRRSWWILTCSTVACGAGPNISVNAASPTQQVKTRSTGSYTLSGPGVSLGQDTWSIGWPGGAVGVHFTGSKLTAQVHNPVPKSVDGVTWNNEFDVLVDNRSPITFAVINDIDDYAVADDLDDGEHTAWLVKRTEGLVGSSVFEGFGLADDGVLLEAPAAPSRHLMIVGASNETGYGDLASVQASDMCTYSPGTQDVNLAYPNLLAQTLSAQLTDLAWAGKGVYQNASLDDSVTMPQLYNRLDPNDPDHINDFSTPPDIILMDLGANDFETEAPPAQPFINAYATMLRRLRGDAPNAPIVCIMGPTVDDPSRSLMRSYVQQALAQVGDNNAQYFEFPLYEGSTYGCDYHPDSALQATMAQQILSTVQGLTGW